MALSGAFLADFTSFFDACTKAEVSLRSFESGAGRVETSLNKMVDSFSGRKVIQDATLMVEAIDRIGGASKLTASDLARAGAMAAEASEKMKAMGIDVPPGIQRVADASKASGDATHQSVLEFLDGIPVIGQFIAAFSVERIFEFVQGVIESTARLEDLHLATGISVEDIQKLAFVGKEFGVDIEQMARGVEQLSAKLANGDKNAVAAVQALGLSMQDLLAAGPLEAFLQVAEATGQVESKMQQSGLATEEFGGKLAKVLLPALGNLRDRLKEVPKDAIITDANTEKIHGFEVALEHAETRLKSWTATVLGGYAAYAIADAAVAKAQKAADDLADKLNNQDIEQKKVITSADLMANTLKAWRTEGLEPLTDAQKAATVEGISFGKSQSEIAKAIGATEIAVHQYAESLKTAKVEQKKAEEEAAKAIREADAITMTVYTGQIAMLQKLEAQRARSYGTVEQIAMLERLQTAEDELTNKVLAELTSEKDRARVISDAAKTAIDIATQKIALQEKVLALTNKAVVAEFEAQVALNKAQGLDAMGAVLLQDGAYKTLQEGLARLQLTKQEGISQQAQITQLENNYTKSLNDEAVASDNESIASAKSIEQLKKKELALRAVAAAQAAASAAAMTGTMQSKFSLDPNDRNSWDAKIASFGPNARLAFDSYNNPYVYIPGVNAAPPRALGGPVTGGQSYLVGDRADRQPEIFTPGASGFITPLGTAGGGGGVTVQQTLVFHMVDTESNLVRRVASQLQRSIMSATKLGAP